MKSLRSGSQGIDWRVELRKQGNGEFEGKRVRHHTFGLPAGSRPIKHEGGKRSNRLQGNTSQGVCKKNAGLNTLLRKIQPS